MADRAPDIRAEAAPETRSFLEALDEVSEAVEAGAGLPAVARSMAREYGPPGQRVALELRVSRTVHTWRF